MDADAIKNFEEHIFAYFLSDGRTEKEVNKILVHALAKEYFKEVTRHPEVLLIDFLDQKLHKLNHTKDRI